MTGDVRLKLEIEPRAWVDALHQVFECLRVLMDHYRRHPPLRVKTGRGGRRKRRARARRVRDHG